MKKIGTTLSGSVVVEVTESEYESLRALLAKNPRGGQLLAWDAIQEEKKRFPRYQFLSLHRQFSPDSIEDDAGITIEALLKRIEESPGGHRLPFGFTPQLSKKLKGILELKRRNV